MKKLFTAFATIVLVLGLPSAAIANEAHEIALGGEDPDGDKIDLVFGGKLGGDHSIADAVGFMKIDCFDIEPTGANDEEVELAIRSSTVRFVATPDCIVIELFAGVSLAGPRVEIHICSSDPRTKLIADNFDVACNDLYPGDDFDTLDFAYAEGIATQGKEADVSIKLK